MGTGASGPKSLDAEVILPPHDTASSTSPKASSDLGYTTGGEHRIATAQSHSLDPEWVELPRRN